MRQNIEDGKFYNPTIEKKLRLRPLRQLLSGTFTMDADMPPAIFLDPDATGRTVLLPAEEDGLFYVIANTETVSGDLTVKEDSGSTTIATVAPGDVQVFVCNGTTWFASSQDNASISTLSAAIVSISDRLVHTVTVGSTTAALNNGGVTTLPTGAANYNLEAPVAGVEKVIVQTSTDTNTKTVRGSTDNSVTFNGKASQLGLTFNALGESVRLIATSTTNWAVVNNEGSVGFSTGV